MKWEHACLIKRDVLPPAVDSGTTPYTFYGPDGQGTLNGANSIDILNRLGRDGWEVVAVETTYFSTLTERTFWLKRPLSNR